jgi:predicted  nucleic acid-binding Zn-ribbon protein
MPNTQTDGLSFRLRKLPGQLLLALVNGTAILVIAAALLALVATARVTHLAENVAATMTDAVLSRADVQPRRLLAKIERVSADVHELRHALEQKKADGLASLNPAIALLNERLEGLETGLSQLRNARTRLMDEATARLSLSLGEALQEFGACKAEAATGASGQG